MSIPYRCPVCEGRGTVPAGFYGRFGGVTTTSDESCHSCNGTGIIWDYQESLPPATEAPPRERWPDP